MEGIARRELPLVLASSGARPRHLALYDALREAMRSGRLSAGSRLPSTRDLARQLGLARGTVVAAFEMLTAEGYLCGVRGAGTSVVDTLPDAWFGAARSSVAKLPRAAMPPPLSERGARLARSPFRAFPVSAPLPFRPHTPSVEAFPRKRWMTLVARHARVAGAAHLREVDPRGHLPLRKALAEHLRSSRGVRCEPDQIAIVSGVHQALDVVARLVLDPGDAVWFEDPGYFGARAVLEAAGARIVLVNVDDMVLARDHASLRAPTSAAQYRGGRERVSRRSRADLLGVTTTGSVEWSA
jgi:GntR family transcriptional regulator/MocR family aminotransferase